MAYIEPSFNFSESPATTRVIDFDSYVQSKEICWHYEVSYKPPDFLFDADHLLLFNSGSSVGSRRPVQGMGLAQQQQQGASVKREPFTRLQVGEGGDIKRMKLWRSLAIYYSYLVR